MTHSLNRVAILAVTAVSVLSCGRVVSLPQGDWNPDVHAKISSMLVDCGKVSGTHPEGIGVSNEMKSLYKTLKANGIDVFIVSASLKTVVEAMACGPEFGFDMEPDHVFGLRMKETADGRFSAEYDESYIQTFKEGKTGAIKEYVAPSHGGKGPCLVAGDSNGDYNMLTDFDDMKVGLIINCGNKGNIGALASSGDPKIAIQDRDLSRGRFVSYKD